MPPPTTPPGLSLIHILAFTLLRGNADEVHQALATQHALLLPPGQPLDWDTLPARSQFVVPLGPQ